MAGLDGSADAAPPPDPAPRSGSRRLRLPTSRGGLAWLLVLIIVGGLLAVQFGRQVYANWEIGQRAEALRAQIADVEARNEELAQELAYVRSDAWIGAEARRLTNLGQADEQVLIIPPGAEEPLPDDLLPPEPVPKPLLEQWLDLFFGAG
jgi:cell division protein FtsB